MIINDPDVVAELHALDPCYEEALVTNHVDTLISMFWTGKEVMRFVAIENLYGPGELAAFRKGRPAANLARTITRLDIVSFGRDFASITLEFERVAAAGKKCGRRSQVWVKFAEGRRIVQVRVSILPLLERPIAAIG